MLRAERIERFKEGNPIVIHLKIGQTTEVDFPEKIVKVVSSIPSGAVTFNVVENKFFIQLNTEWEGLIFLLGETGTSYPIKIESVFDNPDVVLKVVFPRKERLKMSIAKEMEIALKQLLKEKMEDGVVESTTQIFYKDKNLVIEGEKIFKFSSGFVGVIGKVKNISKKVFLIPIQQIEIPGLVAISIDKEVLKPEETTKIYLLFQGAIE